MYKSEIRPSTIQMLLDKVRLQKYGEYLIKITIKKIRGFSDRDIRFDFPVTALIGPNGSGKSSVLGAAACAYKAMKPGNFFPKSALGDESMSDWGVSYEIIDRNKNNNRSLTRSANFKQARWNRADLLDRPTFFFGIERTVPTGEKTIFKSLINSKYKHKANLNKLPTEVAKQVEHILGKNVSNYQMTPYNNENFLVGKNKENSYSEFHFGAGESSIIRMVNQIESAPDNSLILIEEIENGLHPLAISRMVEYLIDVADRKSIQVVFTTHSDYALLPLPKEAIWACIDGELHQGKLSVESLRAISGRIDKKLAIFVEDLFAKDWVEYILRTGDGIYHEQYEVHAVNGDGNALKIHKSHIENPAIKTKSLCILDGDSSQQSDDNLVIRLPGKQPEREIFDSVFSHLSENIAKLTIACHLPTSEQDKVMNILEKIDNTNRDPHLIFNQIGDELGFIPENIIRSAFFTEWKKYNIEFCNTLVSKVVEIIQN